MAEKLADGEELEQPAQPKATMAATAEQEEVLEQLGRAATGNTLETF